MSSESGPSVPPVWRTLRPASGCLSLLSMDNMLACESAASVSIAANSPSAIASASTSTFRLNLPVTVRTSSASGVLYRFSEIKPAYVPSTATSDHAGTRYAHSLRRHGRQSLIPTPSTSLSTLPRAASTGTRLGGYQHHITLAHVLVTPTAQPGPRVVNTIASSLPPSFITHRLGYQPTPTLRSSQSGVSPQIIQTT